MPSRFKRAHRTHALAQPAGEPYPRSASGQILRRSDPDATVLGLFAELSAVVSDPARRAELLGVSPEVEAAWQRGAALPLLRAHRRALERALRDAMQTAG
jgi:hypothetical protein